MHLLFVKLLKVETEQYKEMLKKLADYDETLMQARRANAKKDEETEKLRVSEWEIFSDNRCVYISGTGSHSFVYVTYE